MSDFAGEVAERVAAAGLESFLEDITRGLAASGYSILADEIWALVARLEEEARYDQEVDHRMGDC